MGMFFADDSYDESRRMEGFQRYKQLLSFYAGRWVKVNLLTTLGALPLVLGVTFCKWGTFCCTSCLYPGPWPWCPLWGCGSFCWSAS